MSDIPTRPVALVVQPENIPAELKALRIWSNMRYEWNGKKWGKVPYTPFTTSKASSTRPSSWRSFDEAYACLLERPDFFDGLFLCLSADDPYTGGDFDHTDDQSRIPQTYAERSVGGNGSRFIGIGTIPAACKKPDGELYTAKRFLSITGHRLDEFPCDIRPIQPELDKLYEELKGTERIAREGKPGGGDRAALVIAHDDEEWEAARFERRVNINRLLAELRRRSFNNKTGKRDTQLAYLLNENYTGFHNKWPHVGIVRGDGSLDSSQIRAVMANSIKGRGFTFPQFVALMSYFYGKECLDKWGMKERVQEELATLWHISRTPRAKEHQVVIEPVKRGRGSDHAELLEHAYQSLLDHKVGVQAFITQQELADALGINRRTAISLMQELRDARRIAYTAMRSNAGIVVEFTTTVINEKLERSELPHNSNLNGASKNGTMNAGGETRLTHTTVINGYSGDSITERNGSESPSADERDETDTTTVINEKTTSGELGSTDALNDTDVLCDEREEEAPLIGIYTVPVSLSEVTITPQISLKDAVTDALDNLSKDKVNSLGELKRWPVTKRRVIEYVQYEYAGWQTKAIGRVYDALRKARKNQTFEDLKALKRDALEKKAGSVRKRIGRAERLAIDHPVVDAREWYGKQAKQLQGQFAMLAYELGRRDSADKARIDAEGYSEGEQAEFLELVERERGGAAQTTKPRVSLPTAQPIADGLINRLRARIHAAEETRL